MAIIIYHTNDTHARVSSIDDNFDSIGIDKISKIMNLSLLQNKNTFWFDAGDFLHGTPRINISKGENIVKLLNPTHLNALAVGNHDLNYGIDRLCELSKELNAYILSANMIYKDTGMPVLLPYAVYDVDVDQDDYIDESADSNNSYEDNIKIGIFGLTTPEAAFKTNPNNIVNIHFANPIDTAKTMVNVLSKTCHVIIALTHLGLDESSDFTSKKLAEEVDGIDLIIDGHSHTKLDHGLKIGNTLIVQAGSHDHYLGKVTIDVADRKITSMTAELIDENTVDNIISTPDKYILSNLKSVDEYADRVLNRVIAYNSFHRLSGDRLLLRRQESELGNLTADACRYVTGADISVSNGGDVRTDLPEGNITYKDILAIYPFQNYIQVYKVTGQFFKNMLEHSIEFAPEASFGGFLSVSSNVRFSYDPKSPVGSKVKSITINDEPINLSKTYTVSLTEFLAIGGDDYEKFDKNNLVGNYTTSDRVVMTYLREVGIHEDSFKLGRITVIR